MAFKVGLMCIWWSSPQVPDPDYGEPCFLHIVAFPLLPTHLIQLSNSPSVRAWETIKSTCDFNSFKIVLIGHYLWSSPLFIVATIAIRNSSILHVSSYSKEATVCINTFSDVGFRGYPECPCTSKVTRDWEPMEGSVEVTEAAVFFSHAGRGGGR